MKKVIWFLTFSLLFSCSSDDSANLELDDEVENETPSNIPNEIGSIPCHNGMAGIYPCNGYDLVAHISLDDFSASEANDIWGWTDAETSKEYAIMGLDNGTVFIDISDAENPMYLGKLPTATTASSWRDVKVYEDFAYVVSEANGHGVQVFDLKRLRNVVGPPQ
ncbi:MAG: choice-of-anchor B family protein, partial [Maribacter dokdonensis]